MSDPKDRRPQWPIPQPAKPEPKPAGRIRHDERGNAIWDWVKETSRIFVGNTSAWLKKLETPELKMDEDDDELRLEGDRDKGGGYDPYNQRKPAKKPPRK